ncbi:MAG: peptidoglycan-binding protein [Calditrichia bacterium]|nr:peptidoglycan-binding protein [Calditrichia bacterium]
MPMPTLRYGDGFEDITPRLRDFVKILQLALKNLGHSVGAEGLFDRDTERAVIAFQQSLGVKDDGIVRQDTWQAISQNIHIAPSPDVPPPPTPPEQYPVLKYRDGFSTTTPQLNEAVKKLQSLLKKYGYSTFEDGFFTRSTEDAVKSFQKEKDLTSDGVVREDTWKALEGGGARPADVDPAYPGLKLWDGFANSNPHLREDVKRLQEMLKKLGYPIDVDGLFGMDTEDAVKDFQFANGLVSDGEVDKATWKALEQVADIAPAPGEPESPEPEPGDERRFRLFGREVEEAEEAPPDAPAGEEKQPRGPIRRFFSQQIEETPPDSTAAEEKQPRGPIRRFFSQQIEETPPDSAAAEEEPQREGPFRRFFGRESGERGEPAGESRKRLFSSSSHPVLRYSDGFSDTTPELRPDVQYLQELLHDRGYSLDTDGMFGKGTEDAVKDFQKSKNITADGIVEQNTWAALEEKLRLTSRPIFSRLRDVFSKPEEPSTPGDTVVTAGSVLYYPTLKYCDGYTDVNPHLNRDVRRLQSTLNKAGYSTGADGLFGSGTENLVKQFQGSQGLKADGAVNTNTWSALKRYGVPPAESAILNFFWGDPNWVHNWEGHNGSAYWPGGSSGVTLDPGMDLGHADPDLIEELYEPILTSQQLSAVRKVFGIKGDAANRALQSDPVLQSIEISRAQADEIFEYAAVPYWDGIVKRFNTLIYPDTLASVQTALLSLSYNRGYGNSDLEQLKAPLEQKDWWEVADRIGNMQQDHELEGIRKRRQAEADLIRWELNWQIEYGYRAS